MASVGLAAAAVAAYSNSFRGEFTFDDQSSIVKNTSLGRMWPIWSPLLSPSSGGTRGRPFANFTFALNRWAGGLDVAGYHALNLAFHIAAGLVLFGIVRRTLERPILAARFGAVALPLAYAVAALWLVHPLLTEDVTYLSQRTEVLMGLCYLSTLYLVIRGALSEAPGRWYVLAVVTGFLGMASKEIMITAPVVIFFYDRTFLAGSFREAWRIRWRLYLGLASGWILLARLMAGIRERGAGLGLGVGPARYALGECHAIVRYLRLSLWPHPLVFDYGVDLGPTGMAAVPSVLAILVLVTGMVVMLRRQPAVGFAMFWFFAILSPTSSFVPVALQPVGEHRMYLPLAALIALAVPAAFLLIGRWSAFLVAAAAVGLGFATWERNLDYRTSVGIWKDTVAKRPMNARAHCNLGNALLAAGQTDAGMAELSQALLISPDDADTNLDLGVAIGKTGRFADAIPRIQRALGANPGLAEGYFDLGWLYTSTGRIPEALDQYTHAIALRPDYHDAHCNIADLLLKEGRFGEAIPHYEAALAEGSPDPDLYYNLAYARIKTGSLADAVAAYREALRLKPDFAEARHNLELLEGTRPGGPAGK
jgi:Flp pilus assembly protein TadD